jgi:hypothetical protein
MSPKFFYYAGSSLMVVTGIAFVTGAVLLRDIKVVPYIMSMIGLTFTGFGVGLFAYDVLTRRKNRNLKLNGKLVQATFQEVWLNESSETMGKNPYQIIATWHDFKTNEVLTFASDDVWYDPSPYVKTRSIPVYFDENNTQRYFVDLSFLPKSVEKT